MKEAIDIQKQISYSLDYLFEFIYITQPDFLIGKILFYYSEHDVTIHVHACSTVAIINDYVDQGRTFPICTLRFSYFDYCNEVLGRRFDVERMQFKLDLKSIENQILNNLHFEKMQSKYVFIQLNDTKKILTDTTKPWLPFVETFDNENEQAVSDDANHTENGDLDSLADILVEKFEDINPEEKLVTYRFTVLLHNM